MIAKDDIECEACHCITHQGEEIVRWWNDGQILLFCVLCGRAAERLAMLEAANHPHQKKLGEED